MALVSGCTLHGDNIEKLLNELLFTVSTVTQTVVFSYLTKENLREGSPFLVNRENLITPTVKLQTNFADSARCKYIIDNNKNRY